MIRNILLLSFCFGFVATQTLKAAPTPTPSAQTRNSQKQTTTQKKSEARIVPSSALVSGWSNVNGVWLHSDGYKFINGRVVRTGTQTHKRPPAPPTQAEMDSLKKKPRVPTPAEAAAAKAAEKERNLTPRPAPQTGTHM